MAADEAWSAFQSHLRSSHVVQVQPRADQLSAAIRGAATAVKEKAVPAAEVGIAVLSKHVMAAAALVLMRMMYGAAHVGLVAACWLWMAHSSQGSTGGAILLS